MKKSVYILIFLTTLFITSNTVFAGQITDIDNHWAKAYIQTLIEKGCISGYTDGTFKPDNTITRAEFTKILLTAMGVNPGAKSNGYWATYYIREGINRGIIKFNEFPDPDKNISRMEITRMIVSALGKGKEAEAMAGQATLFKDDDSISYIDKGYVKIAATYNIFNGLSNGTFSPNNSATRGEAAKVIITWINNKNQPIDLKKVDDEEFNIDGDKVNLSFPQLLPQIRKVTEIIKSEGCAEVKYMTQRKQIVARLYNSKEEAAALEPGQKEIKSLMTVYINLDRNRGEEYGKGYMPYEITIYDLQSELAQNKYSEIVNVILPNDLANSAIEEMQGGADDHGYNEDRQYDNEKIKIQTINYDNSDRFKLEVYMK